MTMSTRVVALATTFLPVDQARQVLLPPVRFARTGAVAAARTIRHWELMLEGAESPEVEVLGHQSESDAPEQRQQQPGFRGAEIASSDLPVEDWPELSYADAQSRLASCDEGDLRTLLAYEQSHGHRAQYILLLEQRLASGV